MTAQYGVIGHPLEQSLSPLMHNWGFKELGIDAEYSAMPVTPGELPQFMVRVRTRLLAGLSVTIPHKQAIVPFLDDVTYEAKSMGAVNTVFWKDKALWGDNTDVVGVKEPLRGLGPFHSGLVLGAGGAARAAIFGLMELGVPDIFVAARNRAKAEALPPTLTAKVVDWEERTKVQTLLIINATPLGMIGEKVAQSPWPTDVPLDHGATVFDLVYNPLKTRFLEQAEAAGCRTVGGLEMFLHQGLAQFKIWTGKDLDQDKVRFVLEEALKK